MDSETFKSRQQFLNDFFSKDKVDFLSNLRTTEIINNTHLNRIPSLNDRYYRDQMIFFYIDTEATFRKSYINSHIPFKNYHKFLKPFIYFLYSFSNREKFLYDSVFYLHDLQIIHRVFNSPDESEFYGKTSFSFLNGGNSGYGDNFLNKLTISDFTKGINEIHIKLTTFYMNVTEEEFIYLGGIIEEPIRGRGGREEREAREQEEQEEREHYEIRENNKIINSSQCYKSEECVICLTNPPNVLFCNCGHLCYCLECEKLKNSNLCPVCKTKNDIIRVLELN